MSRLLLTFYGDDFTGSTDALEQLTLAGFRTVLFIEPPTPAQLKRFPNLQAAGVAGLTRSLPPQAMVRVLRSAFKQLQALGPRHVHYKVCSTFDSSPAIGSIGCAIDVGASIFRGRFVPVLAAAPMLGRYCIFGNLFARFGIGSSGAIHRLDCHPSASRHLITPMTEANLQLHLARQTKKKIALFDILKIALPKAGAKAALQQSLKDGAEIVLFDALDNEHLEHIGGLLDSFAGPGRPLFSAGSSGIEMALGMHWSRRRHAVAPPWKPRRLAGGPVLAGSGSCSPVTLRQITWAVKHGFAEVPLDAMALASGAKSGREIERGMEAAAKHLAAGRSVIVHTNRRPVTRLKNSSSVLGGAVGRVLAGALGRVSVRRLCVAGGDTSSYAARALGIEALEMIAPLTPGAPVCRAIAPGSAVDGGEIVFKGGQVGGEDYFEILKRGKV